MVRIESLMKDYSADEGRMPNIRSLVAAGGEDDRVQ